MKINDILVEFAPAGGGDSGNYFQALASAWYNGTFDTGSLQKGIKSQQDVERLLNRGIVCPDGKTRKLHIDYNSDFDGVEIYSDDYYEYGDHDDTIDSRTGQKWGPYDFMAFSDEQLDEATGDKKFDSMLSRMTAEPKYPDQDMPPTSIAELIQWADRNNKPYHEYFAQWARRNGFKNVNDALVWFGDNVDPSNPWGPKDFLDPFGRPAAEELEDAAKHDPKAAELMKVFRCYEEIVFDWPDEYRQMNMPVSRKGTDESLNEFAADDGDSGGEDDALRNYARMWWAGDDATQQQIERALAQMGWEIGEDEGGYDNGGVFVVRAGDENGNSYQSWAAEDLTEGVAEAINHIGFAAPGIDNPNHRKSDQVVRAPLRNFDELAGMLKINDRILSGMMSLFPGFPKPVEGIRARHGSHKYYRTDEFKRWVINNGVREHIAKMIEKNIEKKRGFRGVAEGAPISGDGGAVDNFKQQMANNTEVAYQKKQQGMAEGNKKSEPPEADYGDDYQDMVKRVKKLAGLGPLKTQYDPNKRVYRNMPTAVQPRK